MSGIFEHLAYNDSFSRVEQRKALALARVRANKRFGRFVAAGSDEDREARLTLVAGDVDETVRQACADVGYDDWESIRDAITASLGFQVESVRMPKMCPYHREVTDISLAAGDPASGFTAMAQHAWSPNHCQGEWEGRCNFKAEMTTQSYWDQKAERAQERRDERQRLLEQQEVQNEVPMEEPLDATLDTEIEPDFAEVTQEHDMNAEPMADLEPAMARSAEALETVDVDKGSGPLPTMNKDRWTPTNISWDKDAEMDGSRNPTVEQDIKDKPEYKDAFEDDGRTDQTDAVTETQSVTQKSDFSPTQKPAQLPDQANPVTSAEDPDKNPLRKDEDDDEEDREDDDGVKW